MIKKFIAGLIVCLTVFFMAAGYNVGNSGKARAESRASAPPQRTVRVRLVLVDTNADLIDSPLSDSNITIQAGGATFTQRTNKNGVALFDAVPCGNEIAITVQNGDEKAVLHRRLACLGKGVYSRVITNPFGDRPIFEQRRVQFMGYDPTTGVWRNDGGQVVPSRVIRRRLAHYGIIGP